MISSDDFVRRPTSFLYCFLMSVDYSIQMIKSIIRHRASSKNFHVLTYCSAFKSGVGSRAVISQFFGSGRTLSLSSAEPQLLMFSSFDRSPNLHHSWVAIFHFLFLDRDFNEIKEIRGRMPFTEKLASIQHLFSLRLKRPRFPSFVSRGRID